LLDALGVAASLFMFNQAFGKLQVGTFMGLGSAWLSKVGKCSAIAVKHKLRYCLAI
jgi:hypothetical protein